MQLGGCCKEVVRGRVIPGSPPVGITVSGALEQMDPTCEEFQQCSAELYAVGQARLEMRM